VRNREITETLERERNALASEHGKLTSMLSQTQARSFSVSIDAILARFPSIHLLC
jgi:hypothetical protein